MLKDPYQAYLRKPVRLTLTNGQTVTGTVRDTSRHSYLIVGVPGDGDMVIRKDAIVTLQGVKSDEIGAKNLEQSVQPTAQPNPGRPTEPPTAPA